MDRPLKVLRGGHSFQRVEYEERCNAPKPGNWREACQRTPGHEGMHMARWSPRDVHGWDREASQHAFRIHVVPRDEWTGTGVPEGGWAGRPAAGAFIHGQGGL